MFMVIVVTVWLATGVRFGENVLDSPKFSTS
jgi:hypothetical protein